MAASHQIVHGLLVVRVEPQRPLVSQLGRLIVPPRTGEGLGHVVVNLIGDSLVKYRVTRMVAKKIMLTSNSKFRHRPG